MKYQSAQAFEKHLKEAYPDHLSLVYIVACPFEFERKRLVNKILSWFQKRDSRLTLNRRSAATVSLQELLEPFQSQSLFPEQSCVILSEVEKLKKPGLEALASSVAHPSSSRIHRLVILESASFKNLSDLYHTCKKEVVVLDLSDEKPWDRQRRLKEWLVEKVAEEKKKISTEATAFLFEQIGYEWSCLEQEIEKLICYIGARGTVELKDVEAICSSRPLTTGWERAEQMVWGKEIPPADPLMDLSALLMQMGQVRYHLQLGGQLAAYVERGATSHEIQKALPQLKPAHFDRYLSFTRQRKSPFFREALAVLFELDLLSKSSSLDPDFLWDYFASKIAILKNSQ